LINHFFIKLKENLRIEIPVSVTPFPDFENALWRIQIYLRYKIMAVEKNKKSFITWIKRIGFWGFLFFLIKGLVWLAVGYFIIK
jgi:hypothetical protein